MSRLKIVSARFAYSVVVGVLLSSAWTAAVDAGMPALLPSSWTAVAEHFKPWGHPANVRDPALGISRSPDGFGGPRGWNGAMFLMCDGSVKFLREDTDLGVMKALATPAGGETDESR